MNGEPERDMGIFDPRAARYFSLLPDEDRDEAYCVRHERDMEQVDPVVHHNGGLYTTTDEFSVYYCSACVAEVGQERGEGPSDGIKVYQEALCRYFDMWDEGEALADWFKFLSEGTIEQHESGDQFIAFGASE